MEKLVPKLRFPEFEGNWERKKLSEVSKNAMYGMNSSAIEFDGINKYIRITDIDEDTRSYIPSPLTSPDGIIEEKYKLKANDIVFARTGASVGKSYIYKESDGNLFFAGFLIKFNINRANSKFVFYETLRYNYDKWVKTVSMRSGQPGINSEEYKEFNLTLPQSEEQQKIATFLTSVDERLTLLAQQKEKLELYKKGVMQQIFSQKLRFKDENGNTYPDWEEKKLGEIGEVLNGLTYSPDDISTEGVLVLRSSNVKNRILKFDDNVYVANKSFNPVQENDILICVRNGSKNLIGKNALINKNASGMAFGAFMSIYRSKYNNFIFHWFDTTQYKKIVDMNLGATINSINGSDLKKFNIPFPCIEEQQKIASFLSAIDVQIEGVNKKIAQTKTFKKGLLQQLFV